MTTQEMLSRIDHTDLNPITGEAEVRALAAQLLKYRFASVCVKPCFVALASSLIGDSSRVCTVIGFPWGYHAAETKVFETRLAVEQGAGEIDMVINNGFTRAGDYDAVRREIAQVRAACLGSVLKVIVETCNLRPEDKEALCRIVAEEGCDFIKTSTGFGSAGAQAQDIRLFRSLLPAQVRIKASGGIRTRSDVETMLAAGADRIGMSAALKAFSLET
ncbi:MAG: deoxyribose-phosphate aldolase [Eubacteriales bacterium]|nr:deoxyribose-phosphate aldolase [Eubacteriales bacterium]